MSKKINDNTIDLLYLNEEPNNKKTNKGKTKGKSKNNNVPKKTQDNIIDLDNEIIIGLTPKPEKKQPRKEKVQQQKSKKTNKNRNTQKQMQRKLQNQVQKKTNKKNSVNNNHKSIKKNTIKLKILKWTSISVVLIILVIAFVFSPIFNVKQIKVEGIQKLAQEDIINLSQIQLNENMFKIKISEVAKKIEENTYVESVNITRELPKTIKISIKEREAQYIIQTEIGNAYVDYNGYIIEILEEKLPLPILTGYTTPIENIIDYKNIKKLSDEDCAKLETVSDIAESAKNNDILKYITSIDMLEAKNIKLNLDNEKKVAHLGDGSNANLRILYLKTIIERENGKAGEIYINGDIQTLKPKPYFREAI